MAEPKYLDRIHKLEQLTEVLIRRLDIAEKMRDEIYAEKKELERTLTDCRVDYERRITLLESRLAELQQGLSDQKEERRKEKEDDKKERDEQARRWWSFGPNLVAAAIAFVGVLLTILFNAVFFYLNYTKPHP